MGMRDFPRWLIDDLWRNCTHRAQVSGPGMGGVPWEVICVDTPYHSAIPERDHELPGVMLVWLAKGKVWAHALCHTPLVPWAQAAMLLGWDGT